MGKNKETVLEFTCPKCGGHGIEQRQDVVVRWPITEIRAEGPISVAFDTARKHDLDGDIADHLDFQCVGCGQDFGDTVDLRKHCRKKKAPKKVEVQPDPEPFEIVGEICVCQDNSGLSGAYALWLDLPLLKRIFAMREVAYKHGLSSVHEFNCSVGWYEMDAETLGEKLAAKEDLSEVEGLRVVCEELGVSDSHFVFKAYGKYCNTPIETQAVYFSDEEFGRILKHFNLELPALPEKDAPDGQEAKEGD